MIVIITTQQKDQLFYLFLDLQSRSVREFDERFTSPTFGYKSYEEYYSAASLHTKPLHTIRVPVLCLTAADDPFSPVHAIPIKAIEENPLIAMAMTSHGGHIGFMEAVNINQNNYLDRVFVHFARGIFDLKQQGKLDQLVKDTLKQQDEELNNSI
ncbi:hypothetical protein QZH41_002561 [Actinostola sp. cb2023]|nr:hypothetical protein QZH41_002561 [Actinostola sp. cb2023]